MTETSILARVLCSRVLPVVLLVVAGVASLAALVVEHDSVDTVLGAVTGATVVLAVAVAAYQAVLARVERRASDRRALDGLEPLRAARREDGPR